MNILAIGNSFSQDATRYLHDIALADKFDLKVADLIIGGCSLETHWQNAVNDAPLYFYDLNGLGTGRMISIKQALTSDRWDIVTIQQVSHKSINYDTWQPYLNNLSYYVKQYAPDAEQILHQTWAYEQGSERLTVELGYNDQKDMFLDLKAAYEKASRDMGGCRIIPCGSGFQKALACGMSNLHRDTFHASLGAGRYLLGAIWYETLTGNCILGNTFKVFDELIPDEMLVILKECAHKTVTDTK